MSGRWVAVEGSVAYVTDAGDGVELSDVCDSRTPAALRIPAVASLSKLIRDADRIASLEAEVERLRAANERLHLAYIEASNPGIDMDRVRSEIAARRPVESGDAG